MVKFFIQPDSEIPASSQLYNQIHFAIASRQYTPGHKLPSTRQLAMLTGLHRNTISKVYRMLEEDGVVEAQAGSGIYVRGREDQPQPRKLSREAPALSEQIAVTLDRWIGEGYSLQQIRTQVLAEVDWRLRCSAQVLVTTQAEDRGAAQLIQDELKQHLDLPVEIVPLEDLQRVLSQEDQGGTVVTSHYFLQAAEAIARPLGARVIGLDLYDYQQEMKLLAEEKAGAAVGIVSISPGILRAAEVIVHSLRGDQLLVISANPDNQAKLDTLCRTAGLILCDRASQEAVRAAIARVREDLIRMPRICCSESYISPTSIEALKRELGQD